ncbi:alpha/beta fold hydrolase [Kitasatospora sp. NPDC059646]|uniref:alpha/beta fold hydrolase n=1 Tax=Kitasatospora sp. NPDC059646 TaxID=3346893 RepID=UPI00369C24FE
MSIELRRRQVPVGELSLHVVESGDPDGPPVLLLHGWPESSRTWQPLMAAAGRDARLLAVDLPGIGRSTGSTGGSKRRIAAAVHALIGELGLTGTTLVGHDAGGMAAYAYLRRHDAVDRVVVMNTVLPGVAPWEQVLRNPHIWHFGLHAVPDLPEMLVDGRQEAYFSYFYRALSADPDRITPESRAEQAAAHRGPGRLTAGFDLYRALPQDARDNAESAAAGPVDTPLLYLRGTREPVDLDAYAAGLREAGVRALRTGLVDGGGHFMQEERPAEVWRALRRFAGI